MSNDVPGPSAEQRRVVDELALQRWPEVVRSIDAVVKRFENEQHEVRPGSSLAADNRKADPFHTSHVIELLLNAGIDNLNGIRHLIWGRPGDDPNHPVLHQAAHYVLARAAIEDFATALWILEPASRDLRIERTLRWHVKNVKDQHQAIGMLDIPGQRPLEDRLRRLEQIATQSLGAVPSGFRNGYTATRVLEYVDENNENAGRKLSTFFLWRLCSGFTHGRLWASLAFQEQDMQPTDDPDVMSVRINSDLTRALWAPKEAMHLLERLLALRNQRSRPYYS